MGDANTWGLITNVDAKVQTLSGNQVTQGIYALQPSGLGRNDYWRHRRFYLDASANTTTDTLRCQSGTTITSIGAVGMKSDPVWRSSAGYGTVKGWILGDADTGTGDISGNTVKQLHFFLHAAGSQQSQANAQQCKWLIAAGSNNTFIGSTVTDMPGTYVDVTSAVTADSWVEAVHHGRWNDTAGTIGVLPFTLQLAQQRTVGTGTSGNAVFFSDSYVDIWYV
jgi:hypothetical protein